MPVIAATFLHISHLSIPNLLEDVMEGMISWYFVWVLIQHDHTMMSNFTIITQLLQIAEK